MKVFKRLILIILGVLLVFECYLIFSFLQGYESTKNAQSKQTIPFNGEEAPDQNDLNILIIGTDSRGEDRGRSDSLMVAHYDQKRKQPKLISIMRDSYVDIPGYGKDKINAAYSYGGIELVRKTLKENFDLPIEYYVTINFDHFKEAIDNLFPKGVTIDAYLLKRVNKKWTAIHCCSILDSVKMRRAILVEFADNSRCSQPSHSKSQMLLH